MTFDSSCENRLVPPLQITDQALNKSQSQHLQQYEEQHYTLELIETHNCAIWEKYVQLCYIHCLVLLLKTAPTLIMYFSTTWRLKTLNLKNINCQIKQNINRQPGCNVTGEWQNKKITYWSLVVLLEPVLEPRIEQ